MKSLTMLCALVLAAGCSGRAADTDSASSSPPSRSSSTLKVVPHERLLALLPELPGWTKVGTPQATTDPAEGVSRVQVDYEPSGPDKAARLSIEIMDTTNNSGVSAPLRESLKAKGSVLDVSGFPAVYEWAPEPKNGTVSMLIADRFTVGLTGTYISGIEVLRTAASAIDLKTLATLK
jgi:hypothetical protein